MYIPFAKKYISYTANELNEWINMVRSEDYSFYNIFLIIINSFNNFKSFIKFKLIKSYNLGGK
ncbi:MAG: hypothetical protein ACTSRP_06870 [Candidatus Helarchaeota archaeon]